MSNSSPRSVTPLVLEPGPSRRVRLITVAGYLLAVISLISLSLPLPALLAGIALLCAALFHAWHHHHALSGHKVSARLDSEGRWQWQQGETSEYVELLGDSYHAPSLVMLNFKTEGGRGPVRCLLLATDNIDVDSFRRLRVYLTWQQTPILRS